ncbi:MAG: UDP-N-acetylmuramate dehydrogenase [Synergistaceae bacterium]|nr:UDP-N-acetylmuramate dehydrogenase [Synergistaceae bacterium]
MTFKELLFRDLCCTIKENVPLAAYCTFGAGGAAELVVEPTGESDIIKIMNARKQFQFPLVYLGGGSNVLLSDIDGVVILSSGLRSINYNECKETNEVIIEAGGGYPLKYVVRESLSRGYSGFEFAFGIPGTVGGAVIGNAGAQGEDICKLLLWVECVKPDGSVVRIDSRDIVSGYRYCSLGETGYFITKCAFKVTFGDIELIREKCLGYWSRRSRQPFLEKSAGCIFKNPDNVPAGKLLDECGCKGKRIGDAVISELHANFCINLGNASVFDIKKLICECRDIVYEKKGILLDFEVKMFGF